MTVKANGKLLIIVLCLFIIFPIILHGQSLAKLNEFDRIFTTYPFSDPNPVPSFAKIYPYFRFDGFATKAINRNWKVVHLENDYISVEIMPEIGGKVWSAYDKIHKKYFIYYNQAVKFRDVAMRGPWTSGGIEFNYGIIGHTPNTATPVDYITRTNGDGSVSCIIGTLDLLTRTRWSVEIRLEKDKSYFTTRSFWYNATDLEQPYYQWTNAAVYAHKDLQLIYPGDVALSHNGTVLPWPYDSAAKKQVSDWRENDYGGSKSFHIYGSGKSYFGAYWKDQDFGMMHYVTRDDKPGRKMFTWALSDQGDIWKDLLTDKDGQYVEMQSGRLFNQNSVQSSLTPFKQIRFSPKGSDTWIEYWSPFSGTGGVTDANETGIISFKNDELSISSNLFIRDTLYLQDSLGNIIFRRIVQLKPLQTISLKLNLNAGLMRGATISLADARWTLGKESLSRPDESPANFDWSSVQGLFIYARDLAGLRNYPESEIYLRKCLERDHYFVPALSLLSQLQYEKMNYDSAFHFARLALSVDTYDPQANYYYALAAFKLEKKSDALDGMEIAALSTSFRSAAYTGISRIYLRDNNLQKAFDYAKKSMVNNTANMEGLQLQFLVNRLRGKGNRELENEIRYLEPLNAFLSFERYFKEDHKGKLGSSIPVFRNEFPEQTFLEMAIWYAGLGRTEDAKSVLKLAPEHPMKYYWLAWLSGNSQDEQVYMHRAIAMPADFVFPFRGESKPVLEWACSKSGDWKSVYYLSLLHLSKNNRSQAEHLLEAIKEETGFAPFYLTRASLHSDSAIVLADLKRAEKVGNHDWRYAYALAEFYLNHYNYAEARRTIEPYYVQYPEHYIPAMLYVKTLLRLDDNRKADSVLSRLTILPFEGAGEGRRLYQETKLRMALASLKDGENESALKYVEESRKWPHSMGAGKPYDDLVDERAEDYLQATILERSGKKDAAMNFFNKIAGSNKDPYSNNALLQILSLIKLGKSQQAGELWNKWKGNPGNQSFMQAAENFISQYEKKSDQIDYSRFDRFLKMISSSKDQRLF